MNRIARTFQALEQDWAKPRRPHLSRVLPLPSLEQVAQPVTLAEVLRALEMEPHHADEIAAACRLPNGALHVVLRSRLEAER